MGILLVQSAIPIGTTAGGATSVTSSGITTTAGNTLIACVTARSGSALAVTDSLGNSYTDAKSQSDGTNEVHIFYATNIVAGGGHTLTLTSGGSAFLTLLAQEFSGIVSASPIDVTAGASANALSSGNTAATSDFPQLVVGACINVANTISVGASYSNFISYNASPGSGNTYGGMESLLTAATGVQAATFGGTAAQDNTVVVTFKQATATVSAGNFMAMF